MILSPRSVLPRTNRSLLLGTVAQWCQIDSHAKEGKVSFFHVTDKPCSAHAQS